MLMRSGSTLDGPNVLSAFGVMYLLGYSLDNLSLMALTISTGFVGADQRDRYRDTRDQGGAKTAQAGKDDQNDEAGPDCYHV
jgi:hypothetical protein